FVPTSPEGFHARDDAPDKIHYVKSAEWAVDAEPGPASDVGAPPLRFAPAWRCATPPAPPTRPPGPHQQKNDVTKTFEQLRERFAAFGQDHVFRFWDRLSPDQRRALLDQAA